VLSILIRAEDKGPIFYQHWRIGKDGEPIGVYKFRSMKVGADRLENMLTEEQLEIYKREFKLDDDPRITRVGKFIRKTSLDELPQFLNILKGEMSFVGPRPIVKDELLNYTESEREKLLSVKPGLTGYWQAYARNHATYESGMRQQMELYYIDHACVLLDIKIFFKTVVTVLKRDGAM
jgi:lipopolysaccharide/colanic/teichoic acid biosynthesis glycosyltransferase